MSGQRIDRGHLFCCLRDRPHGTAQELGDERHDNWCERRTDERPAAPQPRGQERSRGRRYAGDDQCLYRDGRAGVVAVAVRRALVCRHKSQPIDGPPLPRATRRGGRDYLNCSSKIVWCLADNRTRYTPAPKPHAGTDARGGDEPAGMRLVAPRDGCDLNPQARRELRHRARRAILEALSALGGEGTRGEILKRGRTEGGFSARELEAPAPRKARHSHARMVDYQLSWALTHLKREGLVENPQRGWWRLTLPPVVVVETAVDDPPGRDRLCELRAMPYDQYLRTPEWRRTQTATLIRAGHRCALDVAHTEDLDVHHNTYERLGAELRSDLVVLCRTCHRRHHASNRRPKRP